MTVALHAASNSVAQYGGSSLARWAQDAREAASIAVSLARTPFVPASLREKPTSRDPAEIERAASITTANITAAVLTGQELGLEPMAALRSIDIITGTPALRAVALRAVVLSAGHDLWLAESTNTRAIVRGRRAGSDHVQESTWTLDRAKALGLAGKDNWRKQPGAMLVARATGECARLIAADALLGVPYAAEELDDGLDSIQAPPADNDPTTGGTAPPRRTAQRRTSRQPAAVHRPPVPVQETTPEAEPDFDEPDPVADPVLITDGQAKKLHAGFWELGVTDRGDRLEFVSEFLDREVETSAELTRDEATRLIDEVERRISARANDTGGDP